MDKMTWRSWTHDLKEECKLLHANDLIHTVKNTTSSAKYPGHRFKQPINDDKATIEASGQECEVKEAVKNTTSTTKHPARRPAGVNQSNNDSV
ncbi:8688_t:CDS:2 [Rhizophagus irregularis]|nr:8688_t:CDS:2 [Rhizophagus irregularis]